MLSPVSNTTVIHLVTTCWKREGSGKAPDRRAFLYRDTFKEKRGRFFALYRETACTSSHENVLPHLPISCLEFTTLLAIFL
jgi:hypothetical protein